MLSHVIFVLPSATNLQTEVLIRVQNPGVRLQRLIRRLTRARAWTRLLHCRRLSRPPQMLLVICRRANRSPRSSTLRGRKHLLTVISTIAELTLLIAGSLLIVQMCASTEI